MDDEQFRKLLAWLNLSWTGYRKVRRGVKKRISRHMQALQCGNVEAYLDLLRHDRQVRVECERRMTVSISRFWRDRNLWLALQREILPRLIAEAEQVIKVWSAGCACGEEVYSFKIVWDRLETSYGRLPLLEMTATDLHPAYIEKARAGIYSLRSLKEVPEEIRAIYFEEKKGGRRFDIKPFLTHGIDWKIRNLCDGPPGSGFHLIFVRNNLLTYYRDPQKKEAFAKIIDSLAAGGWLIVGSHEKLPSAIINMQRHNSIPWAYRQDV